MEGNETGVVTPESTPAPAPTPSVQPAAPQSAPPSSPLNPDVYAPDGKKWSDKYWGIQGALKQAQQQSAEATGGFEQQVLNLTQAVQQRDATIKALAEERDMLREQVGNIPGLQEQIGQLSQQAQRADRYQLLMEFPELTGLRVEQEVQTEAGEPRKVVVNPVLQLIETSQMSLDQLRTTLQQFVTTMPSPGEPQRSPVTSPAIPAPSSPKVDTKDELWKNVMAVHARINEGDRSEATREEYRKAWEAYNEADMPELSG